MKNSIISILALGLIVVGCTHGEKKCDSKETTATSTTAPATAPMPSTDTTMPKEGTVMSEPEVMPKEVPPDEKVPVKKTKKTKKTKKVDKESVTQ